MVAEKNDDGQESRFWSRKKKQNRNSQTDSEDSLKRPAKWSLGILNDRETDEVPGQLTDRQSTFDLSSILTLLLL